MGTAEATLEQRLPAVAQSLAVARSALRDFTADLGVDVGGIELAVSEAVALRDQLIGEGTSQRDKLVSDAQTKSASLVGEAEAKRKKILDDLNAQKTSLETRIAELTTYERDYRRKLKDFISGQLKDLESAPALAPQESAKH